MRRPSDRVLERYRADALDPERRAEVEAAEAEDPSVSARLAALEASDREILARYAPGDVARRVARRVEAAVGRRDERPRWVLPLVALAVAVAVLVVALPGPPTERSKGLGPELLLYREGQRAPLREGERVHPGDVLQIAFVRVEAAHGAILAIDGRGAVTVHAEELPPSPQSGATLLDSALMLDDAPAFERFFLVTCADPVPVDPLVEAARDLGRDPDAARTAPLPLPAGCRQTSRLLIKE